MDLVGKFVLHLHEDLSSGSQHRHESQVALFMASPSLDKLTKKLQVQCKTLSRNRSQGTIKEGTSH